MPIHKVGWVGDGLSGKFIPLAKSWDKYKKYYCE